MIGPEQILVSYTIGAMSIEHAFSIRSKYPRFGIFEWDEETYFWVHGECESIFESEGSMMILRFHKPEDPSAHWEAPENRILTCTRDQRVLTARGDWVEAQNLEVGQSLQHFCGNGHTAKIESVEFAGPGRCFGIVGVHFGSYVTAGLILKGELVGAGKGREDWKDTAQRVGLSRWGTNL